MTSLISRPISRVRADVFLLLAALIWGLAFIAQKSAMDSLGPFTFAGSRFLLSALVVLPLALGERRRSTEAIPSDVRRLIIILCGAFFAAVALQQTGVVTTSVTNAGFLTGLYVVFTPLMAWALFKKSPGWSIALAVPVCLLGTWLLGGGALSAFSYGDWLVFLSAIFFALHTVLVAAILLKSRRPLTLAFIQYAVCAALSLGTAFFFETITIEALGGAWKEILYAGLVSGGIAYTLQIIAQQYTPPSDAAIILSGEALFAALAGFIIFGERLELIGWLGCGLILTAILLVELFPHYISRRSRSLKNAIK